MTVEPTQEELEAAHCWEPGDRIPRDPATTAFRRAARLCQARWRVAQGHPIGSQPIGGGGRPVGSRLPLAYATETGANFASPLIADAVRRRLASPEPNQSIDRRRLLADLLSSAALAANLVGDPADASRSLRTLWPDAQAPVRDVRLLHSPGWLDPAHLGNLSSFDAAIGLDGGGVLGLDVRYHDWCKPEIPKPANLARYLAVAERSGAFAPGATDELRGRSGLATMWLGHLLLLSMCQHPSGRWTEGRYVVVHPVDNVDVADAVARYRELLVDPSTFGSATVESLLGDSTRERYLLRPS